MKIGESMWDIDLECTKVDLEFDFQFNTIYFHYQLRTLIILINHRQDCGHFKKQVTAGSLDSVF